MSVSVSGGIVGTSPAGERRAGQLWRAFFTRIPVRAGFFLIVLMVFFAVASPLITPYSPNAKDLLNALAGPSGKHWLGTDALGRDLLSRLIYGARASLSVGLVSTAFAGAVGISLGLLAGYWGRWVDAVIMRLMDAMMSVPLIILAMFLGGILGKGLGNVMLCIGIVMAPSYARLTRGQVLAVKQLDYVTAGRIGGATRWRNVIRHVLPNCLSPNLVLLTMNLGSAILTEAGLSYLGMGITPPTPSWGAMVSEGYQHIRTNPVLAILPGLFILVTVWSFNVCGDALRDALDPKL